MPGKSLSSGYSTSVNRKKSRTLKAATHRKYIGVLARHKEIEKEIKAGSRKLTQEQRESELLEYQVVVDIVALFSSHEPIATDDAVRSICTKYLDEFAPGHNL